ncbi:Non-canonical purine NTP pyrophosphatase [Syntrophomonas zehnderi OL-4]|uniref:dITP/XTP pyrophosphatase n=1 Tax=Syntrophomonas zehnderi OL-4 TaxID=690567 RepID=A0A0E4G9P3_9FIRM|nr:XTP/dITP diphosphatase [Syntrophomonas zehnderi]CFX18605.1 Non-canonical purine NTP pyrophosphatase [Syntrophomonas zehnderi OL-4]
MSRNLLIATRNNKKKLELLEILKDLDFNLLSLNDIPPVPDVEEDGLTFSENAVKKAVLTAKASNILTLADDSGLVVNALDGAPGVFSARFAGPQADDEQNNQKLLQALQNIADHERTARFVCVIALADPAGTVQTVSGSCTGMIAKTRQGEAGFGYDPLFVPDGFDKSFAELDPSVKNKISHRGQALLKIKPILEEILAMEAKT